jgi:hypothetical protein
MVPRYAGLMSATDEAVAAHSVKPRPQGRGVCFARVIVNAIAVDAGKIAPPRDSYCSFNVPALSGS